MDTHIFDGKYLITGQDGTLGTFYNVDGKFWASNHTHVFRPKNDKPVLLNYLFYYLSYNFDAEKVRTGSCIPKITLANIKDVQVALPSLDAQEKIVEAIDGWAKLAQHEEDAVKILEKQMMFYVKAMGRGQPQVKLETIAKDITFGFMIASSDYGTEGVPVIKTKNIKNKRVMYPATEQKIKTILDARYMINKGDIVIVLGGSPGENGMWEFEENAWLNQDCAKISIENPITKMFVFYSLQGQQYHEYIESNITKTTIGHISRGVIREIEISLPPLIEQQTLQSDFDEIRHKHSKIAIYKAKAQEAIQRLIPGAALPQPSIEPTIQVEPIPVPVEPVPTAPKKKLVIKKTKPTPNPE
jgi:restriction endonuclease S subunit